MRNLSAIILLTLLFCGCKQQALSPSSFMEWVSESQEQLTVKKTIGEYEFLLTYVPNSWLAIKELGKEYTPESLQQKLNEKEGSKQFFLKVRHTSNNELTQIDIANESDYMFRQNYFAYDMQNDVQLFSGSDTIACAFMHYEKDYGISPYDTFVLGFPDKGTENDITFSFNAHQLGLGPMQITIPKETINNIPELIL